MPHFSIPTISALVYGAILAEGIAANQIELVAVLAAFATAVVGMVTWIDSRIRGQIKVHTEAQEQRHELVLKELEHLHELINDLKP